MSAPMTYEPGISPYASHMDMLTYGLNRINEQVGHCDRLKQYWLGVQPAAYLSTESAASLDGRLRRLNVNYPRLVIEAHASRLSLSDITYGGDPAPEWEDFQRAGGMRIGELIHTDRFLYGAAYATVWADAYGQPTITGDTPAGMYVHLNPLTEQVMWAVRRWNESLTTDRAAVYAPDRITMWHANTGVPGGSGWTLDGTIDNVLGVVPVVPFVRRLSMSDPRTGASIIEDVLDLTDAIAKLLSDAMVTSEYFARPRRWATGLEIEEKMRLDDAGNPILDGAGDPIVDIVDPFAEGRHLQSESPDTKFGQFDASRLDGYSDLIATMTQQIGSLTGLPPHYLGLHGDQPPSSDAMKAQETALVVSAYEEQRKLTDPWGDVAWLLDAVVDGREPDPLDRRNWSVLWSSPEIRTPAQSADAALKHQQIGVPLSYILRYVLNDTYPPDELAEITGATDTPELIGNETDATMGEPV